MLVRFLVKQLETKVKPYTKIILHFTYRPDDKPSRRFKSTPGPASRKHQSAVGGQAVLREGYTRLVRS